MISLGWILLGEFVGVGLIFGTDFNTVKGQLLKAVGCFMVMVSTYQLAILFGE